MATKTVLANSPDLTKMNNAELLNLMRASASLDYQNRIPEATLANYGDIGKIILSYQPTMNEFSNMVNRIARVYVLTTYYTNSLAPFKRGELGAGESVEEAFVNIAKAHEYNPAEAESTVWKREMPDISVAFHHINWRVYYKRTVEEAEIELAFLSDNGVADLIGKIIDSLRTSSEIDEYLNMKQILINSANNHEAYPIVVASPAENNSTSIVKQIKEASNLLDVFPSNVYNPMGVPAQTKKNDQYLFVTAAFDAVMDVDTLASAFNMSKVEFMGHKFIIDNFGPGHDNIVAMLVDREFFMVFDKLNRFGNIWNPEGLYTNYTWHVWRIFSKSPYANCIVFTETATSITNVTITPDSPSCAKGSMVKLTAEVTGTGEYQNGVTWEVSGTEKTSSWISSSGYLNVVKNEPNTTLTVTATSLQDSTKTNSVTVTIE